MGLVILCLHLDVADRLHADGFNQRGLGAGGNLFVGQDLLDQLGIKAGALGKAEGDDCAGADDLFPASSLDLGLALVQQAGQGFDFSLDVGVTISEGCEVVHVRISISMPRHLRR